MTSSAANLDSDSGDVWNSGRIGSDTSVYTPCNGAAPQSGKRYYWNVKAWDKGCTETA